MDDLRRQIELLQAQLAALEAGQRASKESGDIVHGAQDARVGAFVADHAQVYGPTVGINLGQIIYNAVPDEEQREQLVRYLIRVSAKLGRLHLRGLSTLDNKGLQLPNVLCDAGDDADGGAGKWSSDFAHTLCYI